MTTSLLFTKVRWGSCLLPLFTRTAVQIKEQFLIKKKNSVIKVTRYLPISNINRNPKDCCYCSYFSFWVPPHQSDVMERQLGEVTSLKKNPRRIYEVESRSNRAFLLESRTRPSSRLVMDAALNQISVLISFICFNLDSGLVIWPSSVNVLYHHYF